MSNPGNMVLYFVAFKTTSLPPFLQITAINEVKLKHPVRKLTMIPFGVDEFRLWLPGKEDNGFAGVKELGEEDVKDSMVIFVIPKIGAQVAFLEKKHLKLSPEYLSLYSTFSLTELPSDCIFLQFSGEKGKSFLRVATRGF